MKLIKHTLFIYLFSIIPLMANVSTNMHDYNSYPKAKINILNKLTGKYETVDISINEPYTFDILLKIELKQCLKPKRLDESHEIGFFTINKKNITVKQNTRIIDENENEIFSGWMITNDPHLLFFKDTTYDIHILQCKK